MMPNERLINIDRQRALLNANPHRRPELAMFALATGVAEHLPFSAGARAAAQETLKDTLILVNYRDLNAQQTSGWSSGEGKSHFTTLLLQHHPQVVSGDWWYEGPPPRTEGDLPIETVYTLREMIEDISGIFMGFGQFIAFVQAHPELHQKLREHHGVNEESRELTLRTLHQHLGLPDTSAASTYHLALQRAAAQAGYTTPEHLAPLSEALTGEVLTTLKSWLGLTLRPDQLVSLLSRHRDVHAKLLDTETCDTVVREGLMSALAQDLLGRDWPIVAERHEMPNFWTDFRIAAQQHGYRFNQP